MREIHIEDILRAVNHGHFRRSSIPSELASGWPCVHKVGSTPCVTIPYYYRRIENEKVALYPLYCSVTVPLGNPERIIDFTIFKDHRDWSGINYEKPAGYFKHDALAGVTRSQYKQMCKILYEHYDRIIACMMADCNYSDNGETAKLFTTLMEPGHYEQYLKINKQFYTRYCKL